MTATRRAAPGSVLFHHDLEPVPLYILSDTIVLMSNDSALATRTALDTLIQEKCNISAARDFQLEHGMDLIRGEDLFLVAAPGYGKTIVMSAPLLYAQERSKTGIAIVVVPSKILTEQQVHRRPLTGTAVVQHIWDALLTV